MNEKLVLLGFYYDDEICGYHKELLFDYNNINKNKRLGSLLFFTENNDLHVHKGRLYHVCENRNEIIEEEINKLKNTLKEPITINWEKY